MFTPPGVWFPVENFAGLPPSCTIFSYAPVLPPGLRGSPVISTIPLLTSLTRKKKSVELYFGTCPIITYLAIVVGILLDLCT